VVSSVFFWSAPIKWILLWCVYSALIPVVAFMVTELILSTRTLIAMTRGSGALPADYQEYNRTVYYYAAAATFVAYCVGGILFKWFALGH